MRKFKHRQLDNVTATQNYDGTYYVDYKTPYNTHPLHIEGNNLLWTKEDGNY